MPLLPYLEQGNFAPLYTFNVDWSDPVNVNAILQTFVIFRCPSSPAAPTVNYATTYISGGNNSFAPPSAPGAKTNVLGGKVYPTSNTANGSTGVVSDYAPLAQVKTSKDANGAEIAYTNTLVAAYHSNAAPSKGALRQNGGNADFGTHRRHKHDHSQLGGGRSRPAWFGDGTSTDLPAGTTGPIWADSTTA